MRNAFESLRQDLHDAVRSLRKTPAFLAMVVFSLALGIAANTTIFSVIHATLYRVKPTDPLYLRRGGNRVVAVALLAGLLPSRWAILVDPQVALRHE